MIMRDSKLFQKQRIEEEIERTRHHYLPSGSPRSHDSGPTMTATLTTEIPMSKPLAQSIIQQSSRLHCASSENKPTTLTNVQAEKEATINTGAPETDDKDLM